ncbi:N-acetylglucosamine kinase [Salinisphaera sp. USBA-960]|uniref:N-acetylglucosamine kinase n=1 Tax=Salinisphaera orenii TaxID=856731 RepID=UPI000DBE5CE5|nr:N-acetylglucosamine kinase [Salifodinibacter halophilus]NNC26131.1 N-acetylglucosamine kinase [Salifodinibacter halophilus]
MYLGVDGGGTKTAFCLMACDGRILAQHTDRSCHHLSIGLDEVERVLVHGVHTVCTEANVTPDDLAFAFFGIPGYGEVRDDLARLDAMPAYALGHDRYACDNDMVCGWAGSLGAVDGINVIAGTGSMAYGQYHGRHQRCGGWGWRFGDEGSAYWIGSQGLNLFTRMSDGRTPRSAFYDLFFERLGLCDAGEVITRFLCCESERQQIAELAVIVLQAVKMGDAEASVIAEQAARELALIVDTTQKQLGFGTNEPVPVSYSGGIFNDDTMVDRLHRHLAALETRFDLRAPLHTPDVGAMLYAAKLANDPVTVSTASSAGPPSITQNANT